MPRRFEGIVELLTTAFAHQRRLAGPVPPGEPDDPAGGDPQIGAVEGDPRAEAMTKT